MLHGPMRNMRTTRDEKPHDTRQTISRLSIYFKPFKLGLLWIGLLLIVDTLLQMAGPYLIGLAVDQFIVGEDKAGLTRTMLLLLVVCRLGAAPRTVS